VRRVEIELQLHVRGCSVAANRIMARRGRGLSIPRLT
jgi:hypothetical protein